MSNIIDAIINLLNHPVTELKETMKPQLGDTISNRYVLVSPLREETGLQVWKACDHVLARYCQLFIVNNR